MNARPTVNVDALGELLDRLLSHPVASLVGQALPASMAELRHMRENLPEALARLQDHALRHVGRELDAALTRPRVGRKGKGK